MASNIRPENTNLAAYLFHQGTNYRAQEYLGAHREGDRFVFRVWAPNALAAFVVGDFNGWEETCPMTRITEEGLWEAFLTDKRFGEGSLYKFKFHTPHGERYKADPYAFRTAPRPETASVFTDLTGYDWQDEGWLKYRKAHVTGGRYQSQPMNVYELHLGSWRRHEDGSYFSYRELAGELASYVKQMGYTHVELLPVMEHPFDGSWGYQVCGYYAPTARFGTPTDFMAFVDVMHQAGIGVILDWVPAHFPKDAHGLYEFDGQPLYEYQGADRMEHKGWGTRCFDVGRNEVECFLISNAAFWAQVYHADGLRVDAVASMLYLDYDKLPGEWIPNVYGDNRNLESIAFFRKLNTLMSTRFPDVLTIAEESGDFGHITSFAEGGLGFSMKWNMGWMNDALSYFGKDPVYRKYEHNKMTFSLMYAFFEKYLLPVSHDEVVHGKKSLLDRMPGTYEEKFAGDRAFLGYMMTHPGKKLLFMGCEIGQFREWDDAGQVEWFLLEYESHAKLQRYVADLNHLYLTTPAFYEVDESWEGFRWIDPDNGEQSVLSYRRIDKAGREMIVALNLTPVTRENFRLGVPDAGVYEEVLNSDARIYGGQGRLNPGSLRSVPKNTSGLPDTLEVTLPGLSVTVFRCRRRQPHRSERSDGMS